MTTDAGLASLHDASAPGAADSEIMTATGGSTSKRGKPTHPVWQLFTAKHEAYKLTNGDTAECLHCHEVVRHHNKVLSVVRHLRKCHRFVAIVQKMDVAERPEWLAAGTKRARIKREQDRTGIDASAVDDTTTSSDAVAERSTATAGPSTTSAPVAVSVPLSSTSSKSPVVEPPVPSKSQHLKTPAPANTAVIKTPASSTNPAIETPRIIRSASSATVRAPKVERTGVPTKRQPPPLLSTQPPPPPARTSYPIALRSSTATATTAAHGLAVYTSYTCVVALSDATATGDTSTVQYFATSAPTAIAGRTTTSPPQLIDTVKPADDAARDAAWIAQDLARVMQSLDVASLCGGVMSSNSLAHQQARAKLSAQHFRSRFFHGCASDGLEMLVASVFGSSSDRSSSGAPPSRSAFLAGFTSDCLRVVQCLTALETDTNALRSEGSGTASELRSDLAALRTPATSSGSSCRTLTRLFAALQRHAAAVHDALAAASRAGVNTDAQACNAVVESATFAPTLETARAILDPIAATAELFTSPRVVLSDVYHAFGIGLPDAFRAIASVSPIEKSALVRACETSFNAIAGDAHGLANLLDPRFLGDGMPREVQERVEDLLFSFPADDGTSSGDADETRQEAIYTQYTEFRVAALAERSKQSFRFQMLRKGRKSALQYWQSDATYWPELQQVALKVFSMAASTAPTAAAPGGSTHNAVDVTA